MRREPQMLLDKVFEPFIKEKPICLLSQPFQCRHLSKSGIPPYADTNNPCGGNPRCSWTRSSSPSSRKNLFASCPSPSNVDICPSLVFLPMPTRTIHAEGTPDALGQGLRALHQGKTYLPPVPALPM